MISNKRLRQAGRMGPRLGGGRRSVNERLRRLGSGLGGRFVLIRLLALSSFKQSLGVCAPLGAFQGHTKPALFSRPFGSTIRAELAS